MAGFKPISFDHSVDYNLTPPALLFGPSGNARSDAADLMREAGIRLADVDLLDGALARLERQLTVSLVWVETAGEAIDDALLVRLAQFAKNGPGRLVVSVSSGQIDAVVAALGEVEALILIDATSIDRAGAIAVVQAERDSLTNVSDVGRDKAARLR